MPHVEKGNGAALRTELSRVKARLTELEATLQAVHRGEVDGIVIDGPEGSRFFTLQSPEEPYRLLAERMNEGVATLAADGTILFCNRRLAKMAETPAERLLGIQFHSLLAREERTAFVQLINLALQKDVRTESGLLRKDGTLLPVLLSLGQVPLDRSTQNLGLVVADLSDQKQVEKEVRRVNDELERRVALRTSELEASNRELEAFAYSVAHDLRAPLRHIHSFLSLFEKQAHCQMDPDARSYISKTIRASARMGVLIDELLQFSCLSRTEIHKQRTNLNDIVGALREDFAPELRDRSVVWKIDTLPEVAADPALLRVVMENLLSNALKFTRRRTPAEIVIGHVPGGNGSEVVFVRDNGEGFDMHYSGKLFNVFQRLHREDEFEGIGIGLAKVRRIVERHQGKVWAESVLGLGATFYFSLPGGTEVSGISGGRATAEPAHSPSSTGAGAKLTSSV